ncbi:MAG TPA: sigma-70 family RNA polymerase sigma factor, partial [Terriglobales bacterium]|nr:sigma-70 family RNA polymerase sigma factor [Terriglobales bacterium]
EDETDEGEESGFMPRQFADWRDVPSEAFDKREIRIAVQKALDSLPPKYRGIFVLRDVQHLSVTETGKVLSLSTPAVKTQLHRARLQMREQLAPVFGKRWSDRLPFLKGRKQAMVTCAQVLKELSNYIDEDIDPRLRAEIEEHLRGCRRCSVLLDSTRKTLRIVGDDRVFEVPVGYSERLHRFLTNRLGI